MKATRTVYTFDELSPEAKEKARQWYRKGDDMPFLEEYLTEQVNNELRAAGYKVEDLKLFYSLSYSQGDGLSFSCTLTIPEDTKHHWNVVQNDNHYTHANTMYVTVEDDDYNTEDDEKMTEEMRAIARKITREGYNWIEQEQSDENVDENILINEYTFTNEGKRLNPDS